MQSREFSCAHAQWDSQSMPVDNDVQVTVQLLVKTMHAAQLAEQGENGCMWVFYLTA